MVVSAWISLALLAIAVLVLLGACWVAVRGLGGISTLRSEVMVLRTGLERCDERITREVKTRAGDASAVKREEDRTILEQAHDRLADIANVVPLDTRPKRPIRVR